MTAALELAGLSPELLEAIVAQVTAKLSVVPPAPEPDGLSTLPASTRRRACERRQADAARGDRSGIDREGLSTIPATVRSREWKRRQAAAKKAAIDRQRLYLHGEAYEEQGGASDVRGPLAGDVAGIVDHAEKRRKLELARLYGAIRDGLAHGSKGQITLPRWWAKTPSEWEDARKLLAEFGLQQVRAAAVSLGETWKPSKEFPRPTISLILWRLEVWRAGGRPAKRSDSRRMTGEQFELRDQARRRAAAALTKSAVVDSRPGGPVGQIHAPEVPSGAHGHGTNPAEGISTGGDPEQRPRETIRQQPAGPPLPASSPPPIGPRDLRGTPPGEVRGKIAEILEQLEAGKSRQGGVP